MQKVMSILFSRANSPLTLDTPLKGSKLNHEYFIDNLLPALNQVRIENARHKVRPTLIVHMDNSMCHNGAKIMEKIWWNGLERALHPVHSPDFSPCDFWAFATIKAMIRDWHLQGPEEILRAIQEGWRHFTFQDFQNVFKSWMERVTSVIANNREYCH
jgi:hypothetical protein